MASLGKRPDIIAIVRRLNGVPMCEEYEKMVSGMLYDPMDPLLLEARHRARGLAADYNSLDTKTVPSTEIAETRLELLKKVVGRVGQGTFVEPPFKPDYGCNIEIGSNTFINWNLTVLDTSLVRIGNGVQIGPNVGIFSAGHETSVLSRQKMVEFGHAISIEDDCWIGGNVVILPGITIGKGSTIGAGSVVTKDVPPFSVAAGNPCRVMRTVPSAEEEEKDPNNPFRNIFRS